MAHRKELKRLELPGQTRFLTCSCYRRMQLFSNDRIKTAFAHHLQQTRELHRFKLWAWVIMPDHIHLLMLPDLPMFPLPKVLRTLKGGFARTVLNRWRELDAPILHRVTDGKGEHFWQPGGGYDRNIFSERAFLQKVNYIHNNPVKNGLVQMPADWQWSSARWYERLAGDFAMDDWPL